MVANTQLRSIDRTDSDNAAKDVFAVARLG